MNKRFLAAGALYLALSAVAGAVVAHRAVHRPRLSLSDADHRRAAALAAAANATIELVSIAAADGVRLESWWITPAQPNGHTAILLHGITSNRAALLDRSQRFLARGYRALATDARAHGGSDGDEIAFGGREADDVARWVAWVRMQHSAGCVYLIGDSLGAAVAVQAANTSGVCAVVAQSTYASLRDVAFDRIGETLGTGRWAGQTVFRPAIEAGLLFSRWRYGVSPDATSAAIANSGPQVLLIHGDRDTNTPLQHAERLQQSNPSRVTLWIVPGASHEGTAAHALNHEERVFGFLAAHAAAR